MKTLRLMRQRGFTLVSAIFLLVVIAALGTFAVTISTTQHQTSTLDIQGARAYQAARAGVEWGIFQVLRNPAGITCSTAGSANVVTMPAAAATLTPFTVNVQCVQFAPVVEGNDGPVTMHQLTSTASNGLAVGSANYVERQISVTIAN
jgi:MSHA biogenesis protein MshP